MLPASLEIIIAPVLTMVIVQFLKLTTDGIKGNVNVRSVLTTYGGMPSAHSSFVGALSAAIAYQTGLSSVAFGLTAMFSLLIVVDAMYFRRHIDRQGRSLTQLISRTDPEERQRLLVFSTRLEHTLPQVVVGIAIGILIASVLHFVAG